MALIYTRQGARCELHPHRETERRCDRCGRPFCDECLLPGRREADGTRPWRCAACTAEVATTEVAIARARSGRVRLARAIAAGRTLALVVVAIVSLGGGLFALIQFSSRGQPAAEAQPAARLGARCGELSRIRSVGAIGTQGADDAVNVLAYPQRAEVMVAAAAAGARPSASIALPTPASAEVGPAALVDECPAGWRVPGPVQLPVSVVLDTKRSGTYIQRVALWQDPVAPRSSWALDFEVLASASDAGDDFAPLLLDRPAQMKESVEPQWFAIMRPGPNAAAPPFPDAVEMRRLMVRVLSTYGSPRERSQADGLALGEVAAYGPDVEILVRHPQAQGGEDTSRFQFAPPEVHALAGEPKFVFFINKTKTAVAHDIVTVNQQTNMAVRLGPDEAKAGQFVAGRPGRYEFYCKVVGHAQLGLIGTIVVR